MERHQQTNCDLAPVCYCNLYIHRRTSLSFKSLSLSRWGERKTAAIIVAWQLLLLLLVGDDESLSLPLSIINGGGNDDERQLTATPTTCACSCASPVCVHTKWNTGNGDRFRAELSLAVQNFFPLMASSRIVILCSLGFLDYFVNSGEEKRTFPCKLYVRSLVAHNRLERRWVFVYLFTHANIERAFFKREIKDEPKPSSSPLLIVILPGRKRTTCGQLY